MRHFEIYEFTCKCGCNKNNMDYEFLIMLDEAREKANIPFIVTSGCRCREHNDKIGGNPNSSHIYGQAADIRAQTSREKFIILDALRYAGFKRIGISNNFIHIDNDKNKVQRLIWTY